MRSFDFLEKLLGRNSTRTTPDATGEAIDHGSGEKPEVPESPGASTVVEDIPPEVKNKIDKILFKNDTAVVGQLIKQMLQINGIK